MARVDAPSDGPQVMTRRVIAFAIVPAEAEVEADLFGPDLFGPVVIMRPAVIDVTGTESGHDVPVGAR